MLISRVSALGTRPVSADYLDKYQLHGISLEQIRRDRILAEALATGADPFRLALVFNINHNTAMAYASTARNLVSSPAEQSLSRPEINVREPRAALAADLRQVISPMRTERCGTSFGRCHLVWGW